MNHFGNLRIFTDIQFFSIQLNKINKILQLSSCYRKDLHIVNKIYEGNLKKDTLKEWIKERDTHGDGLIDFYEFLKQRKEKDFLSKM